MPWIIATTLTVFVPLALIYAYIIRRTVAALVAVKGWERRTVRNVVFGVVSYINLYPVLFLAVFLIGGRARVPAFSGESLVVDLLFAYPFWFGLVVAVQFFFVLLFLDGSKLVIGMFLPAQRPRWNDWTQKGTLLLLAALTVYSVAVIVGDTWTVRISRTSLQLSDETRSLAGTRIVLFSDVQGDGRTTTGIIQDYVNGINELNPDLILFAGDLITSGEDYIESTAKILGSVKAQYGKFAAVGDHDMFSNRDYVVRELRGAGYQIGDDTTYSTTVKEETVSISLITQTYVRRPKMDQLERVADSARGVFKIFLVHQPATDLVEFAGRRGYDMFAAGHTHGGGVAFGIPGLYTFAPANLESRYVSGFFDYHGMLVAVTNGIGMTLAPIRFHAPSEISVITLVY